MASYKDPSFQERAELAKQAKQKALDKLRAKPPVDPAVLAERAAVRAEREKAEAEARAARNAERERAREEAKAEKQAAAEAAALAAQAAKPPEMTEAERKAARDARYAARKNRKK